MDLITLKAWPVGDGVVFNFRLFELNEIMRQKNDHSFAVALGNLAKGSLSEEEINLFKRREGSLYPSSAIHLFTTNESVDNYNRMRLNEMKGDGCIHFANDTCYGASDPKVRDGYIKMLSKCKPQETYGLAYEINLKVGAKYMITQNIDVADGLVNGAIGILKKISRSRNNNPSIIWFDFVDSIIGQDMRSSNKHLFKIYGADQEWTPILKETRAISNKGFHKQLLLQRTQFPVQPAEAMTVHKIQGLTCQDIVLHV